VSQWDPGGIRPSPVVQHRAGIAWMTQDPQQDDSRIRSSIRSRIGSSRIRIRTHLDPRPGSAAGSSLVLKMGRRRENARNIGNLYCAGRVLLLSRMAPEPASKITFPDCCTFLELESIVRDDDNVLIYSFTHTLSREVRGIPSGIPGVLLLVRDRGSTKGGSSRLQMMSPC
jgi:hypothetical protein